MLEIILPLLFVGASAVPELSQVHVISRHGARTSLTKTGILREEGKSTLTPYGEKQMYDLGDWLRRRYTIQDFLGDYNEDEVRFESSHVERTIASANALALGLFPPASRGQNALLPDNVYKSIPVYMTEQRNDMHIRAYGKCPVFHDRLVNLYKSSYWTSVENQYKNQLTELGKSESFQEYTNGQGYIPLSELWNVFDFVKVAQEECAISGIAESGCSVSEMLTGEMDNANLPWSIVESLAHFAENGRYSNETAGDLLGGNLLFRIHERMGGDTSSFPTSSFNPEVADGGKFYHYSAHYPTMLSIFAAMGVPPPSNEVIPDYATAIIFELYVDASTGEKTVYMLFKETAMEEALSIKFGGVCEGATQCSVDQLTMILSTFSYKSPDQWCLACGNEEADACLSVKLNQPAPTPKPTTMQEAPSPTWAPIAEGPTGGGLQPFAIPTNFPSPSPKTPAPFVGIQPLALPTNAPLLNDELSSGDMDELLDEPACPEGLSAGAVGGVFAGGIGLGMLFLVVLRCLSSLRYSRKETDSSDSTDPDNVIDLDVCDGGSIS
jgi:broad specificity phosphatase PhoE